jgi:hypothetical protein
VKRLGDPEEQVPQLIAAPVRHVVSLARPSSLHDEEVRGCKILRMHHIHHVATAVWEWEHGKPYGPRRLRQEVSVSRSVRNAWAHDHAAESCLGRASEQTLRPYLGHPVDTRRVHRRLLGDPPRQMVAVH